MRKATTKDKIACDVAVLGAGPGGYIAAIRCAQQGLKTILIEADKLGGTCLNRGCIPTKTLLHSAEVYEEAKNAQAYGVNTQGVSFDYQTIVKRKDAIVGRLRGGIAGLEKLNGVTLIEGHGKLKDKNTIEVGDQLIEAQKIIIATGSTPTRPPIPGIDGLNVMTSDEVLALEKCPESLVIIGGGVIGIEFASLYATLDKKVTVLEMMPTILPGVSNNISDMLKTELQKKNVDIITNAKVTKIDGGKEVGVTYELKGEINTIKAACCVVSIGRSPVSKNIGLEESGLKLSNGFIEVNERLETNIPGIYAIGDVTGKIQLAHVASAQALVAAGNCAMKDIKMDYNIVPACIYTNPEIAYVGMTKEKAQAAGHTVKIGSFDISGNGKSMVINANVGNVELVTDAQTGQILGGQIFAPRATDMIGEIAVAMKCEGTIEELADTIHAHPTISEIIMEAAHDVEGLCCHKAPTR